MGADGESAMSTENRGNECNGTGVLDLEKKAVLYSRGVKHEGREFLLQVVSDGALCRTVITDVKTGDKTEVRAVGRVSAEAVVDGFVDNPQYIAPIQKEYFGQPVTISDILRNAQSEDSELKPFQSAGWVDYLTKAGNRISKQL